MEGTEEIYHSHKSFIRRITSAYYAGVLKEDIDTKDTVPVHKDISCSTGFQMGERFMPCDLAYILGVTEPLDRSGAVQKILIKL